MRVPLETQRELYDRHAEAAADELMERLGGDRQALIELGRQRAFQDVGVDQYGDSTYFKDEDSLLEEAAAELADAIFYLGVRIARQRGELPAVEV